MAFGVLEPQRGLVQVPGTVTLLQQDQKHVELNPCLSDSPNDPLRWSQLKKFGVLLTVSLGCALSGLEFSIIATAIDAISKELAIPVIQTESLGSYPFLSTAVGCALSAVFARTIGKRPVYLVAAVIHLVGTTWTAVATSYNSLVGGRILFGLAAGTFESMGLATAGDIYFVHQRGRAMSFFSFMALGCTQLAPILAGYMTEKYGWRSIFQALIAFKAMLLLLVIFIMPETAFNRDFRLETDVGHTRAEVAEVDELASSEDGEKHATATQTTTQADQSLEKPRSYLEELLPYRNIHSGVKLWTACVQFLVTGLYPVVWYAFILLGTYLAWFAGIQVTLAQIFGAPPISFGPQQIGYLNTFGVIGALIAEVFLHSLADRSCQWLAKRNRNIYEPEFRLLMVIPAIITALIGYPLYGYYTGVVASEREISWVVASVLFGMAVFCLVQAQSTAFSYLLDAHRDVSIEAGLFAVMLRSLFSYGATTFVPIWIEQSGVAKVFYIIAGLQAGLIIASTTLMWMFGKRVRLFMHRHNPVRKTQIIFGDQHQKA